MDNCSEIKNDLVQSVRLALGEQIEDVRLFAARLVRRYRRSDPELAEQLNIFLKAKPSRGGLGFRRQGYSTTPAVDFPKDEESRLPLLKVYTDKPGEVHPIMPHELDSQIAQLVLERRSIDRLASSGLQPTRSAIFLGNPGVGKTLTARWIAAQLGLPLYVLDLTAVMSSLLGRTGTNIRLALDFARSTSCVLLLDEIDAIAKRRSDDADVGELKRLVTVILQEVEDWPHSSLLLAATNFSELIDPAVWRRFDMVIQFPMPDSHGVAAAIRKFLGADLARFDRFISIFEICFSGSTYNEIEHSLERFRRSLALQLAEPEQIVKTFISSYAGLASRQDKISIAVELASNTELSERTISDITGVSRDTIRKRRNNQRA
jgi:MoxR-like ATPase